MKTKIIFLMILLMMTGCGNPAVSGHSSISSVRDHQKKSVSITFDTTHMNTPASNQYAVWVEDSDGNLIRTIYVSDFTGNRRGYERRKDALKNWVAKADPQNISDAEMNAISGSTPEDGSHTFAWDLKDNDGNMVPAGIYQIRVEGTLYWSGNVVYTGFFDTEHPEKKISVSEERSEPDNHTNETMITNVEMKGIGK